MSQLQRPIAPRKPKGTRCHSRLGRLWSGQHLDKRRSAMRSQASSASSSCCTRGSDGDDARSSATHPIRSHPAQHTPFPGAAKHVGRGTPEKDPRKTQGPASSLAEGCRDGGRAGRRSAWPPRCKRCDARDASMAVELSEARPLKRGSGTRVLLADSRPGERTVVRSVGC